MTWRPSVRDALVSRQKAVLHAETVLIIAIGAFAGANGRYISGVLIESSLLSTAFVNVLGSFALGTLFYEGELVGLISQRSKILFGTGFLSSFTTYSTFVFNTVTTTPTVGAAYLIGSYTLGFVGVVVGRLTVQRLANVSRGEADA